MTTDAKIGLLLGLVFIVIIAFVINGLPSFNKSEQSNDLTNNYVMQVGSEQVGLPSGSTSETSGGEANSASAPIASIQGEITQVNNVIETPLPTKEAVVAVGPEPVVETTLTASEPAAVQSTAVAAVPEATTAVSQPQSTVHVVKKGDNLGKIAQDYYGTQGPKRENVTKIVKANRLKSEKQIYIGQKLVIPSPTALAASQPSMFETVQNVTKTITGSPVVQSKPAVQAGFKDYVVKSGDHPWKIAKKELGNGNRYKEIFKYNPGVNENTKLSIGMHLKLPQK